jgi:hypothetical protein
MTVKCPWAPVKLRDQQGSSLYQARSTYEAEQQLLYALFLYYTYYFECLARVEQLVISTYALQDNMHRIYERYHAISSRRKLSLLAHGPNPCHFLLYYLHYVTIISHHTYYFKIKKCDLGAYSLQKTCQLAHSPLGVSEHTNQEHQGLNHQAPRSLLPLWQLAQTAHQNRSCGCMRATQSAIQA